MGNGSIGSLQRHVDLDQPDAISAVLLSHGHLDHCADLGSLYVIRAYHPSTRFGPLRVFGPAGIAERIAALYGSSVAALRTSFDFIEFTGEPAHIGPFTVTTCAARHPVPSVSIRVEAPGASMVYSGDTGPNDDLVGLAAGADLALFEASFVGMRNPPDLHLSGAQAGAHARDGGVRQLMLTHLVRWNSDEDVLAEASAAFDGPIRLARPGLTVDV
jgi:ribonuclease BN (tRNA processing enzyme)